MSIDYPSHDLATLKEMYANAVRTLTTSLLDGASWEEVQEIRRWITDLDAALYFKIYTAKPAEFS